MVMKQVEHGRWRQAPVATERRLRRQLRVTRRRVYTTVLSPTLPTTTGPPAPSPGGDDGAGGTREMETGASCDRTSAATSAPSHSSPSLHNGDSIIAYITHDDRPSTVRRLVVVMQQVKR